MKFPIINTGKRRSWFGSIRSSKYFILALGLSFLLYSGFLLIYEYQTVSAQTPVIPPPPVLGTSHHGEFDPSLVDDFELRGTITIRNTGGKDIYPPFPIPVNTSSFSRQGLLGRYSPLTVDSGRRYNMAGYLMGYADYFGFRHISICKKPPSEYIGEICGSYADNRETTTGEKDNEYGRLFYNAVAFDLKSDINTIEIARYKSEEDDYSCSTDSSDIDRLETLDDSRVRGDNTLFKGSILEGDAVYFAFKHTPFRILWMNLDVAGKRVGNAYELEWQYYDEIEGEYLPIEDVVDETKSFHRKGEGTISWDLSTMTKMGEVEVGDTSKGCQILDGPYYVVRVVVKKAGSGSTTLPEISDVAVDIGMWWLGMPRPYYPCRKQGNSKGEEIEYCFPFRVFGTDDITQPGIDYPYPVDRIDTRLSVPINYGVSPVTGYADPTINTPYRPTPVPGSFPSDVPDIFFYMNNGEPAKIASGEERVYYIYIKDVCDDSNNHNIKSYIRWNTPRKCHIPAYPFNQLADWNPYFKEFQYVMSVATPEMLAVSTHHRNTASNPSKYNAGNTYPPSIRVGSPPYAELTPEPFDFKFKHLYEGLEGYESFISPLSGPSTNIAVVEREQDQFDVVITNLDTSGLHFGREYDETFFDIGSVDTQQFIIGRKFIADLSERTGIPVRFFWSIIISVLTIMVIVGVQYFIGNQTMSVSAGALIQVVASLPTMGVSSMVYVFAYIIMSGAVIVVRNRN